MSNFETRAALTIALFAAFMAVSDLFAGKYGDDEIMLTNEKASAYQWYQSKSIKQSLTEGESALLKSLLKYEAIKVGSKEGLENHIKKLDSKVEKYDREKKEILLGSAAVGKENWVQDVDGEMGKVIGAKDIEKTLATYGKAGDKFDLASLFYQICLVMGAIAIVIQREKLQEIFYFIMLGLGLGGLASTLYAFRIVGMI